MTPSPVAKSPSSEGVELSGKSNDLTPLFPKDLPTRNDKKGVYFVMGLQGEARIEIDGKSDSFEQNTLVCLTPNHLLSMHCCSENFLFEYVFFEYDFLSDFPLLLKANVSEKMGAVPLLRLDRPTFSLLERYYDLILDRYQDKSSQIEVIKGLLFSLILEISRVYSGRNVDVALSHKNELTDRFFKQLHDHYKQKRTAAFYAGQLCISDKYLLRILREVTGNTFHFWVSSFILKEAKLLLRSTEKSITEISEELQFPNSSFFARFFKTHTSVSPMQFRKGR